MLVTVVLNWSIWLGFVVELGIMLGVVPSRGRWLRDHPLNVAMVLFTPPFLPASLQAARLFRLLRLVRLRLASLGSSPLRGLRRSVSSTVATTMFADLGEVKWPGDELSWSRVHPAHCAHFNGGTAQQSYSGR
jgi:hypothetical protein